MYRRDRVTLAVYLMAWAVYPLVAIFLAVCMKG